MYLDKGQNREGSIKHNDPSPVNKNRVCFIAFQLNFV